MNEKLSNGVRTWTLYVCECGSAWPTPTNGKCIRMDCRGQNNPVQVAALPDLLDRLEGLAGVWKKRAAALEMRYDLDHSEPFPEGQVDGLEACADDLRNLLTTLRGEDTSDA
jgi:hypothetical protein